MFNGSLEIENWATTNEKKECQKKCLKYGKEPKSKE